MAPAAAAAQQADARGQLARYLVALERRYGAAGCAASLDGSAGSSRAGSRAGRGAAAGGAEAALGLGFSRQFHALAQRLTAERQRDTRRARVAPQNSPTGEGQ